MTKKKYKKKSTTAMLIGIDEGPYADWYACRNCNCSDILEEHKYCPMCGLKLRSKDK